MKTSRDYSRLNFAAAVLITTLILSACGGGDSETTASNVSVAVPKSSVIAASKASSKRASSMAAASSIPAGARVSNAALTSHNPGQNCMNCHLPGGTGASRAIFTLAGSISGGAGVTVQLILHNTNQISATIVTDKAGNFYTTLPVNGVSTNGSIVTGVDAFAGNAKMSGVVGNGACNSCHGASRGKVGI